MSEATALRELISLQAKHATLKAAANRLVLAIDHKRGVVGEMARYSTIAGEYGTEVAQAWLETRKALKE